MSNAHVAVVLVDFQNQWTQPGTFFHRLIRKDLRRRRVLENAAKLVAWARRTGARVIHAPMVVDPRAKTGLFAHLTLGRLFRQGTHGVEIEASVFSPEDWVAAGRTAFDAFTRSDLDALLKRAGARTVLVVGFATGVCVTKTLRTALAKGYDGYVVDDCTASWSEAEHRRVARAFPGRVRASSDVVEETALAA